MLDEKNIGNDSSSLSNGNHFPSNILNSIPRKLPIGNSTGYFTRYIEIVREICNSMARVK